MQLRQFRLENGRRLLLADRKAVHAAGRQAGLAEVEQLRSEMMGQLRAVRVAFEERASRLQDELDAAQAELGRLRELHARGRQQHEAIAKIRAETEFACLRSENATVH
jgi:hypothetical protein